MRKRDELSHADSCLMRARDEEMLFVLLGRDRAAPVAIRAWVRERIGLGKNQPDDPQVLEALACARVMEIEAEREGPTMKATRAVTLPPPTEAEVAAQVVAAARLLGISLERRNVGGMYNPRGQYVAFGEEGDPDFEATLPGGSGKRLAVEIKRPGERPTPEQLAKLRALNEAGAVGLWTDDPIRFHRAMSLLIAGGHRVEIDEDGIPWITDEAEPTP